MITNNKTMKTMKNEIYDTVRCKNCWRSFTITRGEYEYFTNRGWELPKRCKDCRSLRRPDSPWYARLVMALNEDSQRFLKKQMRNLGKELMHWP